ncbi:hypothetical protein C8Q79DRAFT_460230 [Trametes meyenii]|nr:hypothetical protein C8Q79DRAFT_460230 [Trametes meyenii]
MVLCGYTCPSPTPRPLGGVRPSYDDTPQQQLYDSPVGHPPGANAWRPEDYAVSAPRPGYPSRARNTSDRSPQPSHTPYGSRGLSPWFYVCSLRLGHSMGTLPKLSCTDLYDSRNTCSSRNVDTSPAWRVHMNEYRMNGCIGGNSSWSPPDVVGRRLTSIFRGSKCIIA